MRCVTGRSRELFELMCSNDLEGIVAKRLEDPYESRVRWLKIKNPDYSQKEGRRDLFDSRCSGRGSRDDPTESCSGDGDQGAAAF
jgi:hypothetical protein